MRTKFMSSRKQCHIIDDLYQPIGEAMMGRCMWTLGLLVVIAATTVLYAAEGKKKSVLDYNDADVERIFREWEVREKIKFCNSAMVGYAYSSTDCIRV